MYLTTLRAGHLYHLIVGQSLFFIAVSMSEIVNSKIPVDLTALVVEP